MDRMLDHLLEKLICQLYASFFIFSALICCYPLCLSDTVYVLDEGK